MSCSQPFNFNPYAKHPERYYSYNQTFFPCGWCLNCRIDKSNQLRDRCEYEYIKYKCGAFVTFTIDDNNMLRYMKYDNINKKLVASLSKKRAKEFLDRLNKIVHKQENSLLCNHNYKYLLVGEYGEHGDNAALVNRPHLHCLFFGLDFAACKKLFAEAWQYQGNIYVGNIGDGAISYVLKYLDKQLFGDLAKIKYENHNLERPFQHHSLGLGSGLFQEQHDYIIKHNYNYIWKGHETPVPVYYKNKYWQGSNISPQAVRLHNIHVQADKYYRETGKKPNWYDLKTWSFSKAKTRENNYKLKVQQSGKPIPDTDYLAHQILQGQIETLYPSDWRNKYRLNVPPTEINILIDTLSNQHYLRKYN